MLFKSQEGSTGRCHAHLTETWIIFLMSLGFFSLHSKKKELFRLDFIQDVFKCNNQENPFSMCMYL